MARYRDPSDPSSLWEEGASESQPEPRRKSTSKGWQPRQERRSRQQTYDRPKSSSKTKPAEVSDRVWGLAEHWMERGTAALGKRPPMVNQAEFAKRLHAAIQADRATVRLLRERGADHLNDILARMVDIFWAEIERGQEGAVLQMLFLDSWDALMDRAQTAFMVDWLKDHGKTQDYTPVAKDGNKYLETLEAQHLARFMRRVQEETEPPRKPASDSLNRFRKS